MKKTTLILACSCLIIACGEKKNNVQTQDIPMEQQSNSTDKLEQTPTKFNIEDIKFSQADLGTFPFFTLPKGLQELNKPLQKNFDVCYFPIDGIITPIEGKLFKTNVTAVPGEEFSQRYFEKSIEDYLVSIGGVKVFNGEITQEQYNSYHKQDPNKGADGDIGYPGEIIQVFVIRSEQQGNIYVQYTANNAGGKLNIVQQEALQQTITKITADEIAKDLIEKGKSILYINFDIDKSTITEEGQKIVAEIATALSKDLTLRISIEGHTDNTGDGIYNKKLSTDRANAVMNSLINYKVDKARLLAKGFGAEHPLVANDSESNKAKNRRVELVRIE